MIKFIIIWLSVGLCLNIYFTKKDIELPLGNTGMSLFISFIMVGFLELIQLLFGFLLSFFIG